MILDNLDTKMLSHLAMQKNNPIQECLRNLVNQVNVHKHTNAIVAVRKKAYRCIPCNASLEPDSFMEKSQTNPKLYGNSNKHEIKSRINIPINTSHNVALPGLFMRRNYLRRYGPDSDTRLTRPSFMSS